MTAKETIERYFKAIHKGDWADYVADDFIFINSNLDKVTHGKEAYIQGAGQFFRATTAVEIRKSFCEGEKMALIARYQLRSPKGNTGTCDVAEFITVGDGKLTSSAIFFDTKALEAFKAQG